MNQIESNRLGILHPLGNPETLQKVYHDCMLTNGGQINPAEAYFILFDIHLMPTRNRLLSHLTPHEANIIK